jgi:hypothetical protein
MGVKKSISPMTRQQKRKNSEVPSKVRIRKIVPEVPRDEAERAELLEDLQTMGCSGFLEKPWGFKDEEIVRELLDGVSNEFDNSIRALPTWWTEEVWREVYNFGTGGGGLVGRKDEYVKDCFKALPNPKDGYDIEDCKDPRHRRLLAFLAPIVYPDKPNRITVTLGNTIFGALIGGRKVNWARIITNLVIQLASRVGKTRASPICPFLYHLYERKELLKLEEERTWKIQEGMMKYGESGLSDEAGSGSGSKDDTEDEEEEEEETQVLLSRPPKRTRQEEKTALGGSLLTPKVEGVPVTSSKDRFEAIFQSLGELQGEHRMRGELLRVVCQIVDCTPTNLPDRIRKLVADHSQAEDSKKLREENAALNLELGTLISKSQAARKHGDAALAAAERIRTFAHQAGEVVAKAELFDEKVGVGSKPSGTRIAMILSDYAEKLERVLVDMSEVVSNVTELRRYPEQPDLAASSSKSFPTLSKLSLPDSFSGLLNVEELTGVEVTPESKGVKGLMDAIRSKSKSPVKKSRDVLMTSPTKEGESGSGKDRFPVLDLNVRKGLAAMDPDQETAGFLTPKITK